MVIPEGVGVGRRRRPVAPLLAAAAALAVAAVLWRLGSDQAVMGGARLAPAAGAARETAGLEGLPTPQALQWRVTARVDPPEAGEGDLVTVTAVAPTQAGEVAVRLPGDQAWRPMELSGDTWNGDYRLWRLSFRVGSLPPGIGHVLVRASLSGETKNAGAILTTR